MPDAFSHNDYEDHRIKKIAEDFEERMKREELFFIDLVQVDELFDYYAASGDWRKAEGMIAFAIQTYPTNSELYLKSARIGFEQGKFTQSLGHRERSLL